VNQAHDLSDRERWIYATLAALVVLVWLATAANRPLFNPDEGRYSEIPREMLTDGDWVIPHLNGLDYIEKPPLQYWATALIYRLFGVNEFSARLYTALCVGNRRPGGTACGSDLEPGNGLASRRGAVGHVDFSHPGPAGDPGYEPDLLHDGEPCRILVGATISGKVAPLDAGGMDRRRLGGIDQRRGGGGYSGHGTADLQPLVAGFRAVAQAQFRVGPAAVLRFSGPVALARGAEVR
jgi:hypothetical protein